MDNWAVGITTAPRLQPTLATCYDSVRDAGWAVDDIWVFAEPGTEVPDSVVRCTLRQQTLGCWPNFYLGACELLLSRPQAEFFLLLEDDAQLFPGAGSCLLRDYLTQLCRSQLASFALLTLYATEHRPITPTLLALRHGWAHSGNVAFVIAREPLRRLLTAPAVVAHRLDQDAWTGTRLNDAVVGRWADTQENKPIGLHVPSLAQHIGATSTLGNPLCRQAANFIGSSYDTHGAWQAVIRTMLPTTE